MGDYTKYQTAKHAYDTPPRTSDSISEKSTKYDFDIISQCTDSVRVFHAPPGPCYSSLKNNVPLTLMKTSLLDWPKGLEEFISQKYLEEYIQRTSRAWGVEQMTEYSTRVENVRKKGNVWQVSTAALQVDSLGEIHISLHTRDFGAVVVASGHYHMPRNPNIPGLNKWKSKYSSRVRHSKTYRSAKGLENQKVLIIGSGVSSTDIAKDLAAKNTQVYQSSRGGVLDLPVTFLPDTTLRVGPVKSFTLDMDDGPSSSFSEGDALPGYVTLQNGDKLCGIHQVILGTGYITSYPFLQQYHSDILPRTHTGDQLLVTSEGDMVHNLHKDIFYIQDPTLALVGVPYHIATFSLYDIQAQIVAKVLTGLVEIPSTAEMRAEYEARVRRKGLGRDLHSLRGSGEEPEYVRELVDWANGSASKTSRQFMVSHDQA